MIIEDAYTYPPFNHRKPSIDGRWMGACVFGRQNRMPFFCTFQCLLILFHEIQSIQCIHLHSQCFRNIFNRAVIQQIQLCQCDVAAHQGLGPVLFLKKAFGLVEMKTTDFAQLAFASIFVVRPIGLLAFRTAVKDTFATTAFVGARLGTSRSRTYDAKIRR